VTDDTALADKIRRLRFHGLAVDAHARAQQGRSPQAEVQEPGFKQNLPDMNAVLALNQLPRLDALIERREALSKLARSLLAEVDGVTPLADPPWPHRHARHLLVVRVDERRCGMERTAFMEALKARNIGTGIHFLAAHTHRWYRENRPEPAGRLANTEWNSARICTLPLFPDMTDDDMRGVIEAVKDALPRRTAKPAVSGSAR
jgi:UDP-4-amino-4-deoxy-L-arabinose-oxoglutarate aminotransferase